MKLIFFKKNKIVFFFIIILFSIFFNTLNASETSGTILSSYSTANLCEDAPCSATATSSINFGSFTTQSNRNVTVEDTGLSGYIWGESFGWVVLNCANTVASGGGAGSGCSSTNDNFKVANDGEGNLSGYAWGNATGWISFNCSNATPNNCANNDNFKVTINSSGQFSGYAWSQNFGWIKFDCSVSTACVTTDCGPASSRAGTSTTPTTGSSPNSPTAPKPTFPIPPPLPPTIPPIIPLIPIVQPVLPSILPDTPSIPKGQEIPRQNSNTIIDQIKIDLDFFKKITSNLFNTIKNILDSKLGNIIAKTISTVGIISGLTVSLISSLFLNPLSFAELFLLPVRLWGLLMTALGLRKRNKPWGTVYDSITKQPLDPAYVVLQDLQGNEVATSITDLDGRYGFLLSPGTYKIIANKTNYIFPSVKLFGKTQDELYNDLYFGDVINISEEGGIIGKNIPLDPIKFDWNEFEKNKQGLMRFYKKRDLWIARVSNILFTFGFIISAIALLVTPEIYNILTFSMYCILLVLKKTALKPKPYGVVVEKSSGLPLPFAIVRVFKEGGDREFIHKVTNKIGKFLCLVPNGRYFVTIEKKMSSDTYIKVYTSEVMDITNGYIKKIFEV